MLTLKNLKSMVENVPSKKAAVPGIRQLEESDARILVREMISDMLITVYQNGYVACRRGRESTVFRLHDCGGYTYWGALEENEETVAQDVFENENWYVVAIMYTQLFNLLCDKADDEHGGRLPYHVRLLLDEFANIGSIPKFDKLIATIRSREISASIILQSQSQLKTIYKDAAETITGNCDTMLFLGGKESSTLKEISETLGKETIDLLNTSDTRGQSQSYGMNYQKTGKELMSRDELSVMDGNKCILQLRGVRPFLSNKYDITQHKRYRELSDYDRKNAFDVEQYLKHTLRMGVEEEFEVFDVEVTQTDLDSAG